MFFRDRFHIQLESLKADALVSLIARLRNDFQLYPVMAIELEFYIQSFGRNMNAASMLGVIDGALQNAEIDAHPAEKERGEQQYEVATHHTSDLAMLFSQAHELPLLLEKAIEQQGGKLDFRAKPSAKEFGSGLHLHIDLQNKQGDCLFTRDEEDSHYSRELLWSLGGLIDSLPEAMLLFAPSPDSYARFAAAKQNAPTTVSWGANNRTSALRLPNKPLNNKHIEHRVSGADADIQLAMLGVLMGVCHGLEHRLFPGDAVFGDASDAQYDLDPLPDYEEALNLFEQSEILPHYLGADLYGEMLRRMLMPDAF